MRRWWACALAVAGSLLLAAGMPAQAARQAAPTGPVPLLWEVRGQGDSRVLLLGAFHLLQASDYPLPADVEQAYVRAGRLVFELPPEQMQSPALAEAMLRAARRRDGSRLQQELPAADWERLVALSGQRTMPLESLQGLQTWFVALNLSLQEMADAGLQAELGLDRHLMARGQRDGKPMAGLETGQAQLALFTGLGQAEQQQMLAEALDEAGRGGAQWKVLHAAWRSGDAGRVWAQAGQELRSRYPALYRAINVDRNQAWLQQLPQWLEEDQGTTLVVVGALHLVGEDGLVEQLRSRGRVVARVCTVAGCPPPERTQRRRR